MKKPFKNWNQRAQSTSKLWLKCPGAVLEGWQPSMMPELTAVDRSGEG